MSKEIGWMADVFELFFVDHPVQIDLSKIRRPNSNGLLCHHRPHLNGQKWVIHSYTPSSDIPTWPKMKLH